MSVPTDVIPIIGADLGRYEACPSSLARGMEMLDFCAAERLTMPRVGLETASERGQRLRPVLSAIPFVSGALKVGKPFDVLARAKEVAQRAGVTLRVGDEAFIATTIASRNHLIEQFARGVRLRPRARIKVELEPQPLRHDFKVPVGAVARVEARPDVRLTLTSAAGKHHTLLLDFGTGFAPDIDDKTNRQITTLAVLQSLHDPRTESVAVSLIALNDAVPGKLDLLTYDREALKRAATGVYVAAFRAASLAFAYREGPKAEPTPNLAQQLDAAAKTGEHCKQCVGRICCGRIHREMKGYEALLKASRDTGAMADTTLRRLRETPNVFDDDMNLNLLSQAIDTAKSLRKQGEVFDKLREEAEDLGRQAILKGKSVPGFGLKDGAKRLNLVEHDKAQASGAQTERDVSPSAVYTRLKPVLPGVDETRFVQSACKVDPTRTRDLIADVHKVDPKDVFTKVLKPLGEANPFEMRSNEPSVVPEAQANIVVVQDASAIAAAPAKPKPAEVPAAPLPQPKQAGSKGGVKR